MVSQAYKDAIYPGINERGRKTFAEVIYTLTAPDSKEGGIFELPLGNEISRPDQVMNEIRLQVAPVGTLEPDNWWLDGRFMIPVPPQEQPNLEIGWWSDKVSDGNGYFAEPLVIERVFDSVQTFNTLGIVFDVEGDNACADFDVSFYNGFGALDYKHEERDNMLTNYRTPRAGIDILRVVVTIYRTAKPFRFARIIEMDFGMVLTYTNNELSSVNLINEVDPTGRSFIYPELSITILNDGNYDQFDPTTYAPYFVRRQRFEYRHGVLLDDGTVGWVDCGAYLLARWSVSDSVVTFRAAGRTFELENNDFFGSSFETYTIAQLIRRFYPQTDIDIPSPQIIGYFGNVNYRRALTMLIELSCCLVYEDRNNRLQFVDVATSSDYSVDSINYRNIKAHPNATIKEYFNSILLAEYDMSIETRQISRNTQSTGNINVVFSAPIKGEPDYTLPEGYELEDVQWHTMYMTANLIYNGTGEELEYIELIIRGEVVTLTRQDNLYFAPWYTGREEVRAYPVNLPFFIRNSEGYSDMKEWFLTRRFDMLERQLYVNVNWRGNPDREVGEYVNMQYNERGATQGMHITKTEISFNGTLEGNISGIGKNPLLVRGG